MALLTANGFDVLEAALFFPRIGTWHADIVVNATTSEGLTGQIKLVLNDGDLTWVGTPQRAGEFVASRRIRLVAGANGLGAAAQPRFWQTAPSIRIVLSDLLNQGGERLSSTADAGVLNTTLRSWTTFAQPVGTAIDTLMRAGVPTGTAYRFLPDGTFWCGPETWPTTTVDFEQLIDWPEQKRAEMGAAVPLIQPGVTLPDGRRVSSVETRITAEKVRQYLYFDNAQGE